MEAASPAEDLAALRQRALQAMQAGRTDEALARIVPGKS